LFQIKAEKVNELIYIEVIYDKSTFWETDDKWVIRKSVSLDEHKIISNTGGIK
jgi:hypothetical protein